MHFRAARPGDGPADVTHLSHRCARFLRWQPALLNLRQPQDGGLSADPYDPQLNRAYRELAELHGALIDPSRACTPRTGRASSRPCRTWATASGRDAPFGASTRLSTRRRSGLATPPRGDTTADSESRCEVFDQRERAALLPLPERPFELVAWKHVKVHRTVTWPSTARCTRCRSSTLATRCGPTSVHRSSSSPNAARPRSRSPSHRERRCSRSGPPPAGIVLAAEVVKDPAKTGVTLNNYPA